MFNNQTLPVGFYITGVALLFIVGFLAQSKPRVLGQIGGVFVALVGIFFISCSLRPFYLNHKLMHHGVEVEAVLVKASGCYGEYTFEAPGIETATSQNMFKRSSHMWKTPESPPPEHLTAMYLASDPEINGPKGQQVSYTYLIFLGIGVLCIFQGIHIFRTFRNKPSDWSPAQREQPQYETIVKDVLGRRYRDLAEKNRQARKTAPDCDQETQNRSS